MNLASLAVLYLLLAAEFVAAAQVLVYAGAIMVMFLFVIAYLGGRADAPWAGGPTLQPWRRSSPQERSRSRSSSSSALKAGDRLANAAEIPATFGSPARDRPALPRPHLLAFEVTSIVLLVAAVGGVILGTARCRGRAGS